jgi:xanthine permease XanP
VPARHQFFVYQRDSQRRLHGQGRGGGTDEILSTIFGVCFFAAFIEVVLSQFIGKLRMLITPVVTGTIIT